MDELLRFSDSDASPHGITGSGAGPNYGSLAAPWRFAARYSPRDLSGHWIEFVALTAGRTGMLLGCCETTARVDELRAQAREVLRQSADPLHTLGSLRISTSTAVCAVIDRDTIGYSATGNSGGAIVAPGAPPELLIPTAGRLAVAPLEPGTTVVLSTGAVSAPDALLRDCAAMHPEQLADRVILDLTASGAAGPGTAAILYRHPPEPLSITLPAEPGGLSVSRGRLRQWLTSAGLDAETCADVLLAVGEATANATEHAVVGARGQVDITVGASFQPGALRLLVSDTGRWKPESPSSGHRGHGIRLMNALMNSVDVTTDQQGTTVTMAKELPR